MIKKTIVILLLALTLLLIGCGSETKAAPIHEGETYLDGGFYNNELHIGYSFYPDGSGFQFIGTVVNPIRYGVFEGKLYLSVGGEAPDALSFEEKEDLLEIGSLPFTKMEDDPEVGQSIAEMLSAASVTSAEEDTPGLSSYWILPILAIIAFVLFLAVWSRKKALQNQRRH